jgi:hypothetical protein
MINFLQKQQTFSSCRSHLFLSNTYFRQNFREKYVSENHCCKKTKFKEKPTFNKFRKFCQHVCENCRHFRKFSEAIFAKIRIRNTFFLTVSTVHSKFFTFSVNERRWRVPSYGMIFFFIIIIGLSGGACLQRYLTEVLLGNCLLTDVSFPGSFGLARKRMPCHSGISNICPCTKSIQVVERKAHLSSLLLILPPEEAVAILTKYVLWVWTLFFCVEMT